MMSLIKKMNLKKVCLTLGCLLAVGFVSLAESNAGAVPWTFNALFGPARNSPAYYGAGYAPRAYTTNYGGYPMTGSANTTFYNPTTTYYGPRTRASYYGGPRNRAQSRRSTRVAYRWYLLNNSQSVGMKYSNFAGGNSAQFAGVAYGPGCCSPCGLGGCSTGNCASGNCSSGQCGVNYNSVSNSNPVPDPNAGGKAPEPRVPQPRDDVVNTPPKTFADEPMLPDTAKSDVEDSGFNARRYKKTPMPKSEEVDPFKPTIKREPMETPKPSSVPSSDGFDLEKPKTGPDKKRDDFFPTEGTQRDTFKLTPDGKLPKTTIQQKKAAPTKQPAGETPKAEQETKFPQLRVRPLNLDQKITWKSAPKAERLTIRAHISAPVVAKQNIPANTGWFAINDSTKIASK
ncbi:MAG: hypothetical protein QM501_13075 [Gimesia sp.]